MTEMRCPSAFCVPPERVEAALQSQTDRISRFVCFLTFPSVTFVIGSGESRFESREEHGNFSPHVEGKTGLRPGINIFSSPPAAVGAKIVEFLKCYSKFLQFLLGIIFSIWMKEFSEIKNTARSPSRFCRAKFEIRLPVEFLQFTIFRTNCDLAR